MILQSLPAEFRLVAACCIWPRSERRNDAICRAVSGGIDWNKLVEIARRQRVMGLVADGVKEAALAVPPPVAAKLAAEGAETARDALKMASEALRIQAAFDAAMLPCLFVKGSALALLAYGNLGIKQAWDIDLLVAPADVPRACEILETLSYDRLMPPPGFPEARFRAWVEIAREGLFRNATRNVHVELHWRLSDNRAQLADVRPSGPSLGVEIAPGKALRTLAEDDLFAYLCLHGAHHAWARMKWLADVAAWLASKPEVETLRLYRRAQAKDVGRAAGQALLLSHLLFELPLPPDLLAELRRDRTVRWLVKVALDCMTGDRILGSMRIEASHFLIASGVGHWLEEVSAKSIGWTDFQRFALPRPLYFLYPVLRLPSWLWRRVGASS
ncbi:MAG TPA: nucleotidyltransferase family protein [Rhizomicrobium sp.]|nr:nucleotidyltransferase family protein [Rhizomicrobium sp.]